MTHTQTTYTNRIAFRAGKKGARPAEVGALASVFEKSATELKQKLLKCKQTIQIATFNVRTLNRIGQLPELTASAVEHKIDIICKQENRYTHTEDIKYHETGNGWMLVTVSAWKNSVNASVGGVGMLIGPRALKTLNSIERIQPRMMAATFNGNPKATIISCYSPTNVSEDTELVTFYEELSSLLRSIPKHNLLVIGGDMNTQIGKNRNNKYSLNNTSNRNGQHLIDFMIESRLTCLNTNFQKREGKLWTHAYANKSKAQIDYLFINRKWENSAMNCEAYSTFEGVSSDHRIVTAKIRLSLRKNATRTATIMAFDPKLIPLFDGTDAGQSVVEWVEKAELVCRLSGVKHIECVVLMRLSGGAYAVYQQLSEEKRADFACIKDVLYTAFALSPVTAYKQFAARRLRPGETVDVYLAELRQLATQFGGMTERGLVCAFIAGLPEHAENLLQATTRVDDLPK